MIIPVKVHQAAFALAALAAVSSAGDRASFQGLSGVSLAVPYNDGILAVPWGWGELLFAAPDEAPRAVPFSWNGARPCSQPSTFDETAAVCLERDGSRYVLLFSCSGEALEYGPYTDCGAPVFDGSGGLWFTADGTLHLNGASTGLVLDAHTISVDLDGGTVAYCDDADRLCSMETRGGEIRILSSCSRFYGPRFILREGRSEILVSTLEGRIVLSSPVEGTHFPLAPGSHPFWWTEKGLLLYSVTEDDGHDLTSAEIWALRPGEAPFPLSSTEEVLEIHPFVLNGVPMAIDAATGSPVTLRQP